MYKCIWIVHAMVSYIVDHFFYGLLQAVHIILAGKLIVAHAHNLYSFITKTFIGIDYRLVILPCQPHVYINKKTCLIFYANIIHLYKLTDYKIGESKHLQNRYIK